MLQLSSVFWIDAQGKITPLKDTQVNGVKYGYSTMYIREDTISKIVLLDKEYIDGLMAKETNKP